tara:strand:- start:120 stop:2249 length:2130 start_codon:yes stop_codon:yes gene_type:complete
MRPDRQKQMLAYLTRPAMAEGGRIGFKDGPPDTSPVKTEEYKYPKGNKQGTVYSKTPGTNQSGALTRTLEEVQEIIDNADPIPKKNKLVEMNSQDLAGISEYNNVKKKKGPAKVFVSRRELKKYEGKLNFKTTGKSILEDASKKNKARQAKDLARSNPSILTKIAGKEGYQLSHLSLGELDTLKNLGYLPANINIDQYHPFEKKIVAISKDIYDIQNNKDLSVQEKRDLIAEKQKEDRVLRKKFPEYAKTKARLNVKATGLDSSGLMIKEKLPDPSIAIAPDEAGTTLKEIKTGSQKDVEVVKIAKENFLKNLENKKFRKVSNVLIDAATSGGFGEAVQTICKRRKAKKGGRMFVSTGSGCPAAKDDPKGFLRSVSENPKLAKFLKSAPGKKAMTMAARVTGNVLNPTTLIGGEVAFVLGDGLNNFASGLPLDESFDRAFVFADLGKFEKNLINQAKELGYDDNQLNLLQQTININKLDNKRKKLEFGLDVEEQDPSGLTSDATMGFEDRLVNTNKNLDDSVGNYLGTLDKMGFDINKATDQATGFRYLDNVFKKRTQDQLVKDFEDRKRQVDPTKTPFGDFISPVFDLGSYTQPLKFAADIVNPFTKDVPFLSERQQEAKKLREMSEEKLDAYNKARGFTIEDIQQGTSPQIRETMNYLGTDVTGQGFGQSFAGGGIAKIAGIDQGPAPTSGPNSQGLPGLLKRGIKI